MCSSIGFAALLSAALLTVPIAAAQPLSPGAPDSTTNSLPPPADSGKPAIVPPPAAAAGPIEPGSCVPALPCGTRLLGTIRRNGAIELQVPALRW